MRTPEERRATWLKKRLNTLISQAGYNDGQLAELQRQLDADIKAVTDRYAGRIDTMKKRRDDAVDKIHVIISNEENWALVAEKPGSKTLTFRAGVIKRHATSKIEVTSKETALAWLRKNKLLRRFTIPKEPEISKTLLKKDKKVLARIPGVEQLSGENMTVIPVKTQSELDRDLHPMRRSSSTT